jgi:hypothetical protein
MCQTLLWALGIGQQQWEGLMELAYQWGETDSQHTNGCDFQGLNVVEKSKEGTKQRG